MSEFNKEALLGSLIAAGHKGAQEYAFGLVTGGVVNNNGTNANLAPTNTVTTPGDSDGQTGGASDIGHEIDATTLDARGFPWDSRIHAKTKTQNKDKTWKYAVGVDKEVLVPSVEAELREQGYGQPQGAAATTPPPVNTAAPGAPTNAATPGAPGLPGAPGAPAAPGLPPVGVTAPTKVEFPAVNSEDDMDDNAMIQTAAALMSKHGPEVLKKLLTMFGVAEGATAKDVQAGYKFAFWQYASSDEYLKQQSIL